ncbi:MAG: alpha-ketoacid dehydrogenase subunit beta [Gammaproteobacteria bacterium]|nr:alpha-ketoacid dehydrogenase subunit beta [Gammaproteobacteria bacterium]MXW46059.1 alpha-ketoacid dehydrogenase subunit beta [Gammaproteobacteria bacterium]MYD02723.1 alpha-ketoacid dehydrogenase subunit beta [Gammaproteobacteria bacterium]MYI25864.1 alpha-ketoacid dehydrogenase subunit beta [Gammaproteobacteria bacterium]
MSEKSFRQAINEALREEMRRDPTVFLIGEDIAGGTGGEGEEDAWGGVMGVTKGLLGEFGASRVIDTPISETAYIGAAAGAAVTGMRPVAELMFCDFAGVCFDQIMNQTAKLRYMLGGQAKVPLVIRMQCGGGFNAAAQHSQTLHGLFTHIPGLKVVMPSNPYEAKGLLIESIRDDDPVMFMEHKFMYDDKGEVPDESYTIPLGEAHYSRDGEDITICALGRMVNLCNEAADDLAQEGIGCTVIDLRSTSPLDEESICESVEETGRLVVVDEGYPRCGFAADIAALAAVRAQPALRAPVKLVTPPHTTIPFAPTLEELYIPSVDRIKQGIREVLAA